METLAQRIIARRKKRRWSQTDLANAADVPVSTLCDIEKGRVTNPSTRCFLALAGSLGANPARLFYGAAA